MMNFEKNKRNAHFHLFSLLLSAIFGALAFALKIAMAAFPNIEPVTLILLLSALTLGARAFITCGIYVLLEGLVYGFSTWWIPYLYAWPLLIAFAMLLKRFDNRFVWAAFAGVYGFLFGFLFLPVNYFVYNMAEHPELLTAYLINDIPFNTIHAISNFVVVLCLLPPMKKAMRSLLARIR